MYRLRGRPPAPRSAGEDQGQVASTLCPRPRRPSSCAELVLRRGRTSWSRSSSRPRAGKEGVLDSRVVDDRRGRPTMRPISQGQGLAAGRLGAAGLFTMSRTRRRGHLAGAGLLLASTRRGCHGLSCFQKISTANCAWMRHARLGPCSTRRRRGRWASRVSGRTLYGPYLNSWMCRLGGASASGSIDSTTACW